MYGCVTYIFRRILRMTDDRWQLTSGAESQTNEVLDNFLSWYHVIFIYTHCLRLRRDITDGVSVFYIDLGYTNDIYRIVDAWEVI